MKKDDISASTNTMAVPDWRNGDILKQRTIRLEKGKNVVSMIVLRKSAFFFFRQINIYLLIYFLFHRSCKILHCVKRITYIQKQNIKQKDIRYRIILFKGAKWHFHEYKNQLLLTFVKNQTTHYVKTSLTVQI